jgi:hypothetical protein
MADVVANILWGDPCFREPARICHRVSIRSSILSAAEGLNSAIQAKSE